MAIRLSNAGKMPCKSWSLQARDTCPGSIDPVTKQLVPACSGCYATVGNYPFKNVREPREENRIDWLRNEWVADMVALLDTERYFRWFDSGDVYHPKLAEKIYSVMQQTPWVKHWLPTRSHKIARIRVILEKMKLLPNVVVRYSSDSVTGEYDPALHGSTIIPTFDSETKADTVCDAYEREGKCGPCRKCWSKDINTVAYVAHTKRMQKVIREIKQAA